MCNKLQVLITQIYVFNAYSIEKLRKKIKIIIAIKRLSAVFKHIRLSAIMSLFRSVCEERTAVLMVATWKSGETGRRGNRLHVTLSECFCKIERSQWSSLSFGLYGTISTFKPTRNVNRCRAATLDTPSDSLFLFIYLYLSNKFIWRKTTLLRT